MEAERDIGQYYLDKICRLREVREDKHIKQMAQASFPGAHCPLMGAMMVATKIPHCCFVVLGTSECTFYNKLVYSYLEDEQIGGNCWSLVLSDSDIAFGSCERAKKHLRAILKSTEAQVLMLATTCIIEIIGDDYDGLIAELEKELAVKILLVHTEHISCKDHVRGMELALEQLCKLFVPAAAKTKRINLLEANGKSSPELRACLEEQKLIPTDFMPALATGAATQLMTAQLNIVVNSAMLGLAKKIKENFAIPYIYLEKDLDPEKVLQNYQSLYSTVGERMPQWLIDKYKLAKSLEQAVRLKISNKQYIYGNSSYECWSFNSYLIKLGMIPLLIQANAISSNKQAVKEIKAACNPFICKGADLTALKFIYDKLKPDYFIGRENEMVLKQKGIGLLEVNRAAFGFEACISFLEMLNNL